MRTWMGNLMHNQVSNRPDAREPAWAGPVIGPGRRRPVRHRPPLYVNAMTYTATARSTARRTSCGGAPAAPGADTGGVRRSRVCVVCGAGLPRAGSARRRYCSDACRSLAYRDRQTSERIIGVGLLTAEAEFTGDTEALARLLCPEYGQPVLPGCGDAGTPATAPAPAAPVPGGTAAFPSNNRRSAARRP